MVELSYILSACTPKARDLDYLYAKSTFALLVLAKVPKTLT